MFLVVLFLWFLSGLGFAFFWFEAHSSTQSLSTQCWSWSLGALAQCSDWQVDLLCFVATGIGPQISIKDLRVATKGDLTLALQISASKTLYVSKSWGGPTTVVGWVLAKPLWCVHGDSMVCCLCQCGQGKRCAWTKQSTWTGRVKIKELLCWKQLGMKRCCNCN